MSANVQVWKNVQVAIQSAIGAALTISAITQANPGVATSTAHGLANGDFVLMSVQGMYQVDGMVIRAAGVTANTFQLEGIDSTLFNAFSSGSCQKLTFGTTMATALDVNASGGDFGFIDVTTIHDNVKRQVPGLPNPAIFTFNCIWDPTDTAMQAFKLASDTVQQRAVRITWPSAFKAVFNGYIGCALLPGGSQQDKVTSSVVITMFGKNNTYGT